MNSIDSKYTISIAYKNSVLVFLDLILHSNEHNKICVDVYGKPTNRYTHVLPSTCCPEKSIKKFLNGLHYDLEEYAV